MDEDLPSIPFCIGVPVTHHLLIDDRRSAISAVYTDDKYKQLSDNVREACHYVHHTQSFHPSALHTLASMQPDAGD